MAKRSYDQYCGLAVALDTLGERWTLLVLRELLHGPKRFTDLFTALPGISTALLADRLRTLEAAGAVTRAALPPPAASAVYALTPEGRELEDVIVGLARWGLRRLDEPAADERVLPDWVLLNAQARFDPRAAGDADGVYELVVDDVPFRLDIAAGTLTVRAGTADAPIAAITTDARTLVDLDRGTLTPGAAIAAGRLDITGDLDRAQRLAACLGLGAPGGALGEPSSPSPAEP